MRLTQINFDGIVGPSHNYAGLSFGNLASTRNAGRLSSPRAAALQGLAKMRSCIALGLVQGLLVPHPRPAHDWLARLGTTIATADPALAANAMSASPMWAANAATVSPAPDTADGRCHLTVANLSAMAHRSHEWRSTLAQLRLAFADRDHFCVHPPVPPTFGDEGAANHLRLSAEHGAPGLEIFVHGRSGGSFPARQHVEASRAVARLHRLDPARTLFVAQSDEAIAAGAFHNDVVAVADRHILLAHEQAFAERDRLLAECRRLVAGFVLIEVPQAEVPLDDAVASYLFNGQLVSSPDGATTLIVPTEARSTPSVWNWLERHLAGPGPIRRVELVDLAQSMANGGGPACLRLRVPCDPATVDPRFLLDEPGLDRLAALVERHWPETIDPADLASPALIRSVEQARLALLDELGLGQLGNG